jgi:radical SAM protein with 4Fe4S-binding SPASM domain
MPWQVSTPGGDERMPHAGLSRGIGLAGSISGMLGRIVSRKMPDALPWIRGDGLPRSIRSANVGLTGRCNLHCVMCSAGHSQRFRASNRPHRQLSELAFDRFLEAVKDVPTVSISGRGEPLLADGVTDKLRSLREACPRGSILLTTNGSLLRTQRLVEQVLGRVNALHVSVNGLDSSYDEIMRGSRFSRIVENLRMIQEARGRFPSFKELAVTYVVMRQNVGHIVAAAAFFKDLGLDGIIYREMSVCDPSLRSDSIRFDPHLHMAAEKELRKAASFAEPNGFWVSCEDMFPENAKISDEPPRSLWKKRNDLVARCSRPWTEFLVDEEGDVRICCLRNTHIGNLNRMGFDEIWNGREARNYRKGLLEGKPYKHCRDCRLLFPNRQESFENLIDVIRR